jgi:hypothetical protein
MNINIKIIPHSEQRYETIGDWWFEYKEAEKPYTNSSEINPLAPTSLEIRVSNLGNTNVRDFYGSLCIAVHELIEVILCSRRGITQEQVDKFDKDFESKRQEGNTNEPGDDPAAPYRKEHFFATSIERLLAAELGIDWKEYEDKINSL